MRHWKVNRCNGGEGLLAFHGTLSVAYIVLVALSRSNNAGRFQDVDGAELK